MRDVHANPVVDNVLKMSKLRRLRRSHPSSKSSKKRGLCASKKLCKKKSQVYVSELKHNLIDVTASPVFTRFLGSDNRMLRGMKVLVACLFFDESQPPNMAADHAQTELNPAVPGLHAVFASLRVCNARNSFLMNLKRNEDPLPY